MSTISSGTTITTALVQTGDTTGDLVIKTGSSNTTAMTISGANQSVTFAGAVNVNSSAFANGSASSPSITFTGDTNTGIFSPAADTIAFSEGGIEAMRIDSSGNVGIGTSSPGTKLDAYSSGTTSTLIRTRNDTTSVYLDANNGYSYLNTFTNNPMLFGTNNTERMRIDSSGSVGVGTTSPLTRFTVSGGYISQTDGTVRTYLGADGSGGSLIGTTTNNYFRFVTNDTERFRIGTSGQLGIGPGTSYGSSGQVLTSQGSGSAPIWSTPAGGKVLQIVQVTKTDRFSTTSTSYVDITGMSANITPSSTSSRILVMVDLKGSASNSSGGGVQLQRNSSAIYIGDAQGSRRRSSVGGYWPFNGAAVYGGMAIFLDSPATTSSVNYKLQCVTNGATFAVNSSHAYTDSTDNLVLASSITLLEIAA